MLVNLARNAINMHLKEDSTIEPPENIDDKFYQKMGVFVTLNSQTKDGLMLRGCIGHPLPEQPLIEALIDAAISSAFDDPRFKSVTPDELNSLVVEVSIITQPEVINVAAPNDYYNHIKIGEDGLIVRWRFGSGLLLPQVAVEYSWDAKDFLNNCCMKAGATPDCWLTSEVEIYKFQAIVFDEVEPCGQVVRRKLK
jgi:uncharacterized protein (TIGR00296 family)